VVVEGKVAVARVVVVEVAVVVLAKVMLVAGPAQPGILLVAVVLMLRLVVEGNKHILYLAQIIERGKRIVLYG
jgi:hypothetical protein